MTLWVFPDLPGLDIAQSKRPEIKSQVFVNPLSGRESRLRFQVYPKYTFKISLNALIEDREDTDLQALMGFMLHIGGQASAFLYRDPTDHHVDRQSLGTGDGIKTAFQLQRGFGGFIEPVHYPDSRWLDVYVDEVLQDPAGHAIVDGGIVVFNTAPGSGAVVTWTGDYFYRVRLLADGYDVVRIAGGLYECQDIEFIGSVRAVV